MWVPSTGVAVTCGVTAGVGALCILRDQLAGAPWDRAQAVRADGRVAIVTGASSGIGREAALELARRGARVFMACRDLAACEAERRDIVFETRNKHVYCRACDLASLASVRAFVDRFRSEEPKLDVLVLNAAVMRTPRSVTRDGIELQLGVNHMGHFLLTRLVEGSLADGARVVVVSCAEHRRGRLRTDDLNAATPGAYDPAAAYTQSKLANVLFANELARRLLERDVCVVSVDPGWAWTRLERHAGGGLSRALVRALSWPFTQTPRAAAQRVLRAALDPALHTRSGDYLQGSGAGECSQEARDPALAAWLWAVSERWTGLQPAAPPAHSAPAAAPAAGAA